MKQTLLVMIAAFGTAAIALTAPSHGAEKSKSGKTVTVALHPQNNSGESGTAKLTAEGDQTKVAISLKGTPKEVTQPAHIHEGTCANLDPKPKQGLASVKGGKSTTTVPISLESLLSGNMAINVHKSTDDIKTYVACGEIKASSGKKK
ncbi:MAG TPA: CHRD domain-containing protein [Burkholderiales bacterium]|jgi:Cu/Zn superoxide dismutase|nr:CHRD domain-containing protein [Burkholderiales bacterium]